MLSKTCEQAIDVASQFGAAILKVISANDTGKTGGHQCGFYLPKSAARLFTRLPPIKGTNGEEKALILWHDGQETDSRFKWYGKGTRSEYRLTRFGDNFQWLSPENVGSLFVLVPTGEAVFQAFVLDTDDDIEAIQTALGVEIIRTWAFYNPDAPLSESPSERVDRMFQEYAWSLDQFPPAKAFSEKAIQVLEQCPTGFAKLSSDDRLLRGLEQEYRLFKMAEQALCQDQMASVFRSVDDYLRKAQTILQRRKARAGRSFENQISHLLRTEKIPFDEQPRIDGNPDFVIPSAEAYLNDSYPADRLIVLATKRTCKDRWRQVTREGKRVATKHLMTIQNAVSASQIEEMRSADVQLVVPRSLHGNYPKEKRHMLLSINQFIGYAQGLTA